ncbi:hypothetical protein F5878DRAFT_638727 [Lentinula raphanica]|uniref:Uncharacterized protein n=1 Tax=Lentinula raphanica TaxID=153919 RepID=A0AA38PGP5_9AGAR|nr:hypothetical protein F5878DRAFT_638727 [Lentinula raphanica]
MSNTLGFAILELNGSNYSKWESTMTAYLCFTRAWGVVSGQDERSAETYSGSGSDHVETTSAELKKEIHEWDKKDDSAIEQYGTPHAAGIPEIFKEAINFESIFAQLDDFGLKLTDWQIQAIIFLAVFMG